MTRLRWPRDEDRQKRKKELRDSYLDGDDATTLPVRPVLPVRVPRLLLEECPNGHPAYDLGAAPQDHPRGAYQDGDQDPQGAPNCAAAAVPRGLHAAPRGDLVVPAEGREDSKALETASAGPT